MLAVNEENERAPPHLVPGIPSLMLIHKLVLRARPAPVAVFLKKLLSVNRRVLKVAKGEFYIDPISEFGMILIQQGEYEPHMTETLENILKPSGVFVDIGANEGYFSVLAGRIVGSTGRIIAVEPQARAALILAENIRLNALSNVTVVPAAISDRIGQAFLHLSPDTNTGSTSLRQTTKYRVPTEVVQTATLSELFERYSIEVADLVKMDIEGFEYEAIFGSPNIFREQRVRYLALELHPPLLERRGLEANAIMKFLAECGYVADTRFRNLVLLAKPI